MSTTIPLLLLNDEGINDVDKIITNDPVRNFMQLQVTGTPGPVSVAFLWSLDDGLTTFPAQVLDRDAAVTATTFTNISDGLYQINIAGIRCVTIRKLGSTPNVSCSIVGSMYN